MSAALRPDHLEPVDIVICRGETNESNGVQTRTIAYFP